MKLKFIRKEKLRNNSNWTVAVHKRTRHAAVVDARSHRVPRMLTLHFLWTEMIERSPASRQLPDSLSAASETANIYNMYFNKHLTKSEKFTRMKKHHDIQNQNKVH